MKKFLFHALMLSTTSFYAQVGIGTTAPTEKLEITGSTAIATSVTVDPLVYVNNASGFTIVGTDPQSTVVNGKILAIENLYTPLIIQPYSISNVYRDDLNDLNLNISTEKFFITIANFEAIPSNGNNGIHTTSNNKGHFLIDIFQSNNMWHVKIGYPTLNTLSTSDRYTYKFDIILYSKRFYKNLGIVTYDLQGSNSGSAANPPSGI
ncbi:MAG: hypothetical protein K0R77_413 [Chryseobacterium sp.]|jgi:pectate lyase|uniref:hypothetical protein n=1 Tax=Chryseobacterium sp. TaxID=1871047 RepID=UPI00260FFBDC|nr:hypothetical protein [Chryseobacterium sp.]MDF2551138.1 hypothetical protein [Chryseobacterium sp.]